MPGSEVRASIHQQAQVVVVFFFDAEACQGNRPAKPHPR
jgi:hypothetical protein